jgi:F420-dependent oxidoreductase-like protein
MGDKIVGLVDLPGDARAVVDGIRRVEEMGIPAVWLTTGAPGYDALTIFSAATVNTKRVKLGTAITPTWPQHPIATIQQVQVIASLAPGRFRFGIGPGGRASMAKMFGVDFREPVTNVREFVHVAKSLLQEGKVDFDGRHYKAHASISKAVPDVPVMASALGPKAFQACGEVTDGAISWLCPGPYLRDIALPALQEGARAAGRSTPPLIAHFIACVHEDIEEVRASVREGYGFFAESEYYINMFAASGYPEVRETRAWSDELVDAVTFSGDEDAVAGRIRQLFDWGASEVFASVFVAGADREASWKRTVNLLAEMNKTL